MKEQFVEPEFEIIVVGEDVIVTSGCDTQTPQTITVW